MYEYVQNKHACPTDVVGKWSPIKWPVHFYIIPWALTITPINSASLTAERSYLAFTHLCTSAIVLKREQVRGTDGYYYVNK